MRYGRHSTKALLKAESLHISGQRCCQIQQKLIKPESLQISGQSCCQTQQPRPAEVPKVHSPEMEPAHQGIVHAGLHIFWSCYKVMALKKGAIGFLASSSLLKLTLACSARAFPPPLEKTLVQVEQ